ncbi:trypsin-like peptidase domain-containing protein [Streptomyces sp. bgisy027]|uniref:trypsin-like peptidase domain-containing protein n=1 Tax=Streptomyces sp. bgisy027 TaxID=3413770 RepID=UPI003D70BAAF
MSSRIRNQVGGIFGEDGRPTATCFAVAPLIVVTASHVLDDLSAEVGDNVEVGVLDGAEAPVSATVLAKDQISDLAILRANRECFEPITGVVLSDSVLPFTKVIVTGVADIPDKHKYEWLDAAGEWQGSAQRAGVAHLGRLESKAVMRGMSGAPVRRSDDGLLLGIVSSRYNSQDDWLRDSVWVARTEHLMQLLKQVMPPSELPTVSVQEETPATRQVSKAEFRRLVEECLDIDGYDVESDEVIQGKEFDLIGRTTRYHQDCLVGVACIASGHPLSEEDLALLWLRYEELWSTGAINELLVVTKVPPSVQAVRFGASRPGLIVRTLDSLVSSGLNLRGYLRTAAQLFSDSPDGLASYYIEPVTHNGTDLETEVLRWIGDDPNSTVPLDRPLAVLGSYGLGKSSFAIRLTSVLAARAAKNDLARVPVLIKLGEVSSEQSLEGLIGAHFTAVNQVPGYSFPKFLELNRRGKFVVIFDGFDEMKHLVTWPEFKFNLTQFGRLVGEKAKVILLGRPTAFENDEEQAEALHGKIPGRLSKVHEPASADYFEIELAPLDNSQIFQFLERYLLYVESINGRPFDIKRIWQQIKSPDLRDICRRPVQLRMLADILPDYTGDIEDLDLETLYDTFVNQMITEVMLREESKKHRLAFNRAVRRDFLARIAFWMWEKRRSTGILTADQLPDELVAPYAAGRDISVTRRDLVAASPLDRRYGDRIRFAHRSFQEFLVAEEALRRVKSGAMAVAEYDALANDEVANFVKLLRGPDDDPAVAALLEELTGLVSWRVADSLLASPGLLRDLELAMTTKDVRNRNPMHGWEILLPFMRVVDGGAWTELSPAALAEQVRLSDDGSAGIALLCLFLTGCLGVERSTDGSQAAAEIIGILLRGQRGVREVIEAGEFSKGDKKQNQAQRRGDSTLQSPRQRHRSRSQAAGRSAYEYQFADDRIPFIPLGESFVGDARAGARTGSPRLGRYMTHNHLFQTYDKATRQSLAVSSGSRVEIRWFPEPVIEIAKVLRNSKTTIDMRSLGPIFAAFLPDVAFIRDWMGTNGLRNHIKLANVIRVDLEIGTEAEQVADAWERYMGKLDLL